MSTGARSGQAHGPTSAQLPLGAVNGYANPIFCTRGFVFGQLFIPVGKGGEALAVRLHGRPVVEREPGSPTAGLSQPWERDTVTVCFSTTKGVASTVIHRLADRGLVWNIIRPGETRGVGACQSTTAAYPFMAPLPAPTHKKTTRSPSSTRPARRSSSNRINVLAADVLP